MKKLVTCIILQILFLYSFSQTEDFIVKTTGDTTRGAVKMDIEESLSRKIVFRSAGGEEKTYFPQDILSFGLSDGTVFRRMIFKNTLDNVDEQRFTKLLVSGVNSLYTYFDKENRFYLLSMAGRDSLYFLFDNLKTNGGEIVESGNYLNQLVFAAVGCDALQQSVAQIAYREKAMTDFVHRLNKCQQPDVASQSHYKDVKGEKSFYAFVGGLPLSNEYEAYAQLMIRFMLPSISKKTSLNTGLIYSRNKSKDDYYKFITTDIILLPVTIQHSFTRGRVQPYAYAGVGALYKYEDFTFYSSTFRKGLQKSFGITFIFGAGIEAAITKRLVARADFRFDVMAHFPTIGIGYRFK